MRNSRKAREATFIEGAKDKTAEEIAGAVAQENGIPLPTQTAQPGVTTGASAGNRDILEPKVSPSGKKYWDQPVTLTHKASSGVNITSTPGKTTTVLGRYKDDTRAIIEELGIPKSTDFSGNPGGFNMLNTPDNLYITPDQFWNEYNKPFLDKAIARGDEIIMTTVLNQNTLYDEVGNLTGYGREYYYLLEHGYIYVDGRMILK